MSCDHDCDCEPEPRIHAEPDAPPAQPNVPRLTLHIDLPDLDPDVIRREVVETALSRYVLEQTVTTRRVKRTGIARDGTGQQLGEPFTYEEVEQVKGGMAFKSVIQAEIVKQVTGQIQPVLREIMDQQVAEILAGEIQITNQWGEAKGPKVTIRELIRSTLADYCAQRVNYDGSPTDSRSGKTRMEHAIVSAADKVFKEAVAPVVAQVQKELTATLHGRTTEAIAQAVTNVLGFKKS